MTSSSDSSSPNNSLHSFTQNPPTSDCDQTIQDQTIRGVVIDDTTKEGGTNAEDGKKEGSENIIANEPSRVLYTGECSGGGKTMAKKDKGKKSVVGEKRKFIPINDFFIDLRDGLSLPRELHQEGGNGIKRVKLHEGSSSQAKLRGMDQKGLMHQSESKFDYKSMPQEEGGKISENVNVEEGSPNEAARPKMELDLNKKIEDEEDIEEKLKMEMEAQKEIKMEVAHSEEKNEANPSDEVIVSAATAAEVETALKYDAAATEKLEVDGEPAEEPLNTQKKNDEVEVEAEPAEADLIEQQNDAADRIVRDIDLNELPPEYEEDN
ncbi:hypothetical protein TanjilG_18015 [Lupinus angustifolius]|uniref:Uncharacterized protein n=1 Tax=Lupinus angustifolius TaxID=3871 RepID=A0A1J7GRF6_LUPAN|nr:hypothetical protein TanjilG_18015 [Lupinus angustifolius]